MIGRIGPSLATLPCIGSSARSAAAAPSLLSDAQVISLPGVQRRINHLAVDPSEKRLFVAALGDGTLEVLDVGAGKRIRSARLNEPQGLAYLPLLHRIVVAMLGGVIVVVDRRQRSILQHIPLGSFADNYPMSLDERAS